MRHLHNFGTLGFAAAIALSSGCSDHENYTYYDLGNWQGGGDGGAPGGDDGGGPGDDGSMMNLGDMFQAPAMPTTKHVGAAGVTTGLVASGADAALYLLNAQMGTGGVTGELHLVLADGTDTALATGVGSTGYEFSPDGSAVIFLTAVTGSMNLALNVASVAKPATKTVVIPDGVQAQPLAAQSLPSPSGKYLVIGALAPNIATSADLHVIDLAKQKDVFKLAEAFNYFQLILPDDTMIFQNTVGGTAPGTAPPLQTLFSVPLATAGTATPTTIDTRTANLGVTSDLSTLVYSKTNGDLMAYNLKTKAAPTKLASAIASYQVGPNATGPIAYIAGDSSVHVVDLTKKELLATAAKSVDLLSPLIFSGDGSDLFFFQTVDTQDNQGALYHAQVKTGAAAQLVAKNATLRDVTPIGPQVVYLANVDKLGKIGDVTSANYDGTMATTMGAGGVSGGVQIGALADGTLYFANLTGAKVDTNKPLVGAPIAGALSFGKMTGAAEMMLNGAVHASAFEFSDNARELVYAADATFNATAGNYVGALKLYDTGAGMTVDAMLGGVAELGPVVSRTLFVSAPGATMPGIYLVTY